ncbi:MAG: hypothetical protein AAB758_02090, partial [Patescibacteria group bacterium]
MIAVPAIYFLLAGDENLATIAVVSITDGGFIPEEIRIKKGTSIVFRNGGQKQHWPASNFHPTHTFYPEEGGCIGSKFDACRGLEPGEEYSFKFDIPGTWPVHDHIFPGLTMKIVVVELRDSIQEKDNVHKVGSNIPLPEELKNLDYSTQRNVIEKLVKDDPVYAWDYLKQAFLVNGEVVGNAHEFAHTIGNAIYKQMGLDGITSCDATFAYGCYHGVAEDLLKAEGAAAVLETQKRCLEIYPPEANNLYTGCIHGMGHGLLTWEELNVSEALRDCDLLDKRYRNYCYDGVFMENGFLEPNREFDSESFWNFCTELDDSYQYNCGRYQAQKLLRVFGNDFKGIGQECSNAPNDVFKTTCAESMGYFISQKTNGKVEEVMNFCGEIFDDHVRNYCIIAAAREAIFQEYKNWWENSLALCQTLSGDWQSQC